MKIEIEKRNRNRKSTLIGKIENRESKIENRESKIEKKNSVSQSFDFFCQRGYLAPPKVVADALGALPRGGDSEQKWGMFKVEILKS